MAATLPLLSDEDLAQCRVSEGDARFGALLSARGPLQLKASEVDVDIAGLMFSANLSQTFVNTHAMAMEATYPTIPFAPTSARMNSREATPGSRT